MSDVLGLYEPKVFSNVPCENVVDLGMPWNRLFHAVLWVDVNVMFRTWPYQKTTGALEFLDELLSFHMAIAFS